MRLPRDGRANAPVGAPPHGRQPHRPSICAPAHGAPWSWPAESPKGRDSASVRSSVCSSAPASVPHMAFCCWMLAEHCHREVAVLCRHAVQRCCERHVEIFRIAERHVQHQPLSVELVVEARQHVRSHQLLAADDVSSRKLFEGETAGIGHVVPP